MLTHLCRIAQTMEKLGGVDIAINVIDPDTVSEANLGRQCFCEADLGQPKATVLAQRARAFFGIDVEADVNPYDVSRRIDGGWNSGGSGFLIGCVDNLKARRSMVNATKGSYWLDLGNTADSGQVILGGHGLPNVFDVLPQMKTMKEPKNMPSCSLAEALLKQDLFINSTLANLGGQLIWQLLRHGGLNHHGFFANLKTGNVRPLQCPEQSATTQSP